jgi:hypothetical protein
MIQRSVGTSRLIPSGWKVGITRMRMLKATRWGLSILTGCNVAEGVAVQRLEGTRLPRLQSRNRKFVQQQREFRDRLFFEVREVDLVAQMQCMPSSLCSARLMHAPAIHSADLAI